MHVSCPSAGCAASEPHGRQAFWPGMGLKKSTGHIKQLGDVPAPSGRKVPGGHGTGVMLPSGQKKPVEQQNQNKLSIFLI